MYKQLIVARKDLAMTPGKLSAQVSHGSMAFLSWLIRDNAVGEVFTNSMKPTNKIRIQQFDIDKDLFEQWLEGAFTKVVCQARNKNHLLKAKTMAEEMGMVEGEDFWLIFDSCRTEISPEFIDENGVGRTLTCIGFKPMDSEVIDKIGKKYHLYM